MSKIEADLLAQLDPRRRAALEKMWAATAHIPKDRSLADELVAGRKEEAGRENEWMERPTE